MPAEGLESCVFVWRFCFLGSCFLVLLCTPLAFVRTLSVGKRQERSRRSAPLALWGGCGCPREFLPRAAEGGAQGRHMLWGRLPGLSRAASQGGSWGPLPLSPGLQLGCGARRRPEPQPQHAAQHAASVGFSYPPEAHPSEDEVGGSTKYLLSQGTTPKQPLPVQVYCSRCASTASSQPPSRS